MASVASAATPPAATHPPDAARRDACMHVCMHVMYACMYACMHAYIYVCSCIRPTCAALPSAQCSREAGLCSHAASAAAGSPAAAGEPATSAVTNSPALGSRVHILPDPTARIHSAQTRQKKNSGEPRQNGPWRHRHHGNRDGGDSVHELTARYSERASTGGGQTCLHTGRRELETSGREARRSADAPPSQSRIARIA